MSNQSFADLGVSIPVCNALAKRGFKEPFAIQKKVIGDVLGGRDVLAKSPTGSGKTLAFMVPTIDSIDSNKARPSALVLAPTRELATQIVDETHAIAHSRALKVTAVYGGVSLDRQAREAAKSHIIVATPGRLEDLLNRRAFSLKDIEILVLDEADRMLDMGFKPAVDRIVDLCPADRQTLFFSATLDGEAGRIAKQFTNNAARHEHIAPVQAKADIEHRFVRVERTNRNDALIAELQDEWDLVLVFVRTKRGADRLVKTLKAGGKDAAAMHGDKTQRQRERALADFERGKVTTLVATDVAARGIHVDGIAKVVNYDVPAQTEDYVHRVGRTGRAGEHGVAVTFVGSENVGDIRKLARELKLEDEFAAVAGADSGRGGRGPRHQGERGPRGPRPQGERGGRPNSERGGRPNSERGGDRFERADRGDRFERGERSDQGERGPRSNRGGAGKPGDTGNGRHSNKGADHRKGGKPAFPDGNGNRPQRGPKADANGNRPDRGPKADANGNRPQRGPKADANGNRNDRSQGGKGRSGSGSAPSGQRSNGQGGGWQGGEGANRGGTRRGGKRKPAPAGR